MKHLSLLTTLLLTSSMVYAGWISKGFEYKGDCLEMMCDCVEDDNGNGYCCPDGTAFVNTGNSHPSYTPCKCPKNLSWDSTLSQCVECLTDKDCKSNKICGADKKCMCPDNKSIWDGAKCVQCTSSDQCSGECPVCMEGVCSNSAEIIVPQYGIFAHSTACYAVKEIAHLGPYTCPYDIYVKGHIDDTFLVRDINGKNVCNPNNREHHMADGVLYTIPAGQEVKVYAKDTACSIIAWERDYHGAEARTPQKPLMKIIRSTKTPGYCNSNI